MKKLGILLIVGILSACSSGPHHSQAVKRTDYEPLAVNTDQGQLNATIYAPENVYFTEVDATKLDGIKHLRFFANGFPNSIYLSPGSHSIQMWKDGNPDFDLHLHSIKLEANQNYYVNYETIQKGKRVRIVYWVENMGTGEVIYGKKPENEK
ncbi:hypothetical protein [Vibrio ostreicida]|uniref:hypothetical protein n=1 Tax=Vibrio ostreicida TaxID=526588 RepID=UPI000971207C|nr:hypothetical protein [Vibrio ostreicida]